jgi:hypothetical protein
MRLAFHAKYRPEKPMQDYGYVVAAKEVRNPIDAATTPRSDRRHAQSLGARTDTRRTKSRSRQRPIGANRREFSRKFERLAAFLAYAKPILAPL